MVSSTDRFGQARIKIDRANEHINEFQAHWESFLKTDFCKVRVQNDPEGAQRIVIDPTTMFPVHLVLCPGDAIHNLRSALDYVISEILGHKSTRLAFPMHELREGLKSSFRTNPEIINGKVVGKGGNAGIEEAVAGLGEFILDEIRPYKGADNPLWVINALDRLDKHRLFVPLVIPTTIEDFRAVDDYGNVFGGKATITGLAVNMVQSFQGTIKLEDQGRISAEIFFNEAGVVERQPVLPTLINMRDAAAKTIDRIEDFLVGIGFYAAAK